MWRTSSTWSSHQGEEERRIGFLEGNSLKSTFVSAGVPWAYSIALDEETFRRCISEELISVTAKLDRDQVLVLHISAHGNTSGIGLTDGSLIRWRDFRAALEALDDHVRGTLILCMSSCNGIQAFKIALSTDGREAPFFVLVGPSTQPRPPSPVSCQRAFSAFYPRLFSGGSLEESVQEMKDASKDDHFSLDYGRQSKDAWNRLLKQIRDGGQSGPLGVLYELYRPHWEKL